MEDEIAVMEIEKGAKMETATEADGLITAISARIVD